MGCCSLIRVSSINDEILDSFFYYLENNTPANGNHVESKYGQMSEDRRMAIELFTKNDKRTTIGFALDAEFETDVPKTFVAFFKQRRRWINGNFRQCLF